MAFSVDKTKAGVTNFSKLHKLVNDDPGITTTFTGLNYTGTTVTFNFIGSGPLSSSEDTALTNLVTSFDNTETSDQVSGAGGYTEYAAYVGTASSSGSWVPLVVSASPPNTLIDILIETENGRFAGVRSFGSTKDRKWYMNNTATPMRVVTDSSSRIEVYASDRTKVFFSLIGVS